MNDFNLVSVCFFINQFFVYNRKCEFPPGCIFVCCIKVSTQIILERNVTFMSGYITFEERLEIESMIFQRCSFGEIAKKINKDRSTISREIRRHSVIEKSGYSGFGFNACVHKETCKMGMVCGDKCVKTSCKLCRTCGHCNDYCPKFAEQVCKSCISFTKLAFYLQIVHFRLQTCVSITKVAFRFTNATSRITIKL